jgi:hypothetical protein
MDIATDAYLRMGKVTCVTFSYTFLHAVFFMICRGWSTTSNTVDRNQATNLTMVMGLVYLIYSAYFLSSDMTGMVQIINIMLTFVYLLLGIVNVRYLDKQISIVHGLIIDNYGVPASFQQSIRLKMAMLR